METLFRKILNTKKSSAITSQTSSTSKQPSGSKKYLKSGNGDLPTYDGPPLHFVLIGAGQRARALLLNLLQFCEFSSMVIADESEAAVKETISLFQAHLWVRHRNEEAGAPTIFQGVHLQADDDYKLALKIPLDSSGKEIEVNKWCLIASRNVNHKKDCLYAISKGYHIFCEKPLALTIHDCTAILNAYQASQNTNSPPRRFVTGFVLRHAEMYQYIHSLLSQNFVGRIISCEFNELLGAEHGSYIFRNWRRKIAEGGPNILEKCCHDLDIITWLINSVPGGGSFMPSSVAAFGGTNIFIEENSIVGENIKKEVEEVSGSTAASYLFQHWRSHTELGSLRNPFTSGGDIEDNLVSIIEFDSGVRVSFHLNCLSAITQRRLMICGVEGTIEADLQTGQVRASRISGKISPENQVKCFKSDSHGGGDIFLVVDWYKQIVQTGQSGSVSDGNLGSSDIAGTIRDMYISAVTALAIDEARRDKRIVDLNVEHWDVLKRTD